MASIYDSIFGSSPAEQAAAQARNASFQDWINSRKQAVEQQRTDNVKMARLNALGNVLTTMVQPIGWAVGGNGTGVTGGVQPVDNRQYLDSFTRAMKAADDLRNIGTLEGEYQFKLADEAYKRAQAMEDEKRRAKIKTDAEARAFENRTALEEQKFQNRMALEAARQEGRMSLAQLKEKYKISGRGGSLSVDDRQLIALNSEYADYISRTSYNQTFGLEPKGPIMSKEEFFAKNGVFLIPKDLAADHSSDTTEKPDGEDFSSYRRNGNAGGNGSGEDFSQYKRRK